jgi:hypothetical protein
MDFRVYVKSIKADVAKKELTISFIMDLNDGSLAQAEALSVFAIKDAPAVDLVVSPLQATMDVFFDKKKADLAKRVTE